MKLKKGESVADQYKQAVNFNEYAVRKKEKVLSNFFCTTFIILLFLESLAKISAIVYMKNERQDFSHRKNRKKKLILWANEWKWAKKATTSETDTRIVYWME